MGALITQHCPPSDGQRKLRKESYKGWRGLSYSHWMKEGQEPFSVGLSPPDTSPLLSQEKGHQRTKALRLIFIFIKNLLIFSICVLVSFFPGVGIMGGTGRQSVQVAP